MQEGDGACHSFVTLRRIGGNALRATAGDGFPRYPTQVGCTMRGGAIRGFWGPGWRQKRMLALCRGRNLS